MRLSLVPQLLSGRTRSEEVDRRQAGLVRGERHVRVGRVPPRVSGVGRRGHAGQRSVN